jgi:predicted aconitase
MRLADDEKAMLDGKEGPARQRAMDLRGRYGEALGAERLVDTNNVCATVGATTPFLRDWAAERAGSLDAVFSEFSLDSEQLLEIPRVKAYTCHVQQGIDPEHAAEQGVSAQLVQLYRKGEAYMGRLGVQLLNTCAPYQVGNVPVKGEHCAWMESSAVIYCNGALGARTNAEGRESAGAAMLTGKIPYWGYHLDKNRRGTHLVQVEVEVKDTADWGLLGYWIGEAVQERVPVLAGIEHVPNLARLKHFGAAAASSGGVEMYHILGVTPEAASLADAFGGGKPLATLKYGAAERRQAYEHVNSTARDRHVDYVMLGCPHYSLDQLWEACQLLEGQRVHENTSLWIFTPSATKQIADRNGYTKIISDAGGVLMTDNCSAFGRVMPKGTKVAAVDSAKQAHYLPAIMGVQTWFGTTAECIEAAISGHWSGRMR